MLIRSRKHVLVTVAARPPPTAPSPPRPPPAPSCTRIVRPPSDGRRTHRPSFNRARHREILRAQPSNHRTPSSIPHRRHRCFSHGERLPQHHPLDTPPAPVQSPHRDHTHRPPVRLCLASRPHHLARPTQSTTERMRQVSSHRCRRKRSPEHPHETPDAHIPMPDATLSNPNHHSHTTPLPATPRSSHPQPPHPRCPTRHPGRPTPGRPTPGAAAVVTFPAAPHAPRPVIAPRHRPAPHSPDHQAPVVKPRLQFPVVTHRSATPHPSHLRPPHPITTPRSSNPRLPAPSRHAPLRHIQPAPFATAAPDHHTPFLTPGCHTARRHIHPSHSRPPRSSCDTPTGTLPATTPRPPRSRAVAPALTPRDMASPPTATAPRPYSRPPYPHPPPSRPSHPPPITKTLSAAPPDHHTGTATLPVITSAPPQQRPPHLRPPHPYLVATGRPSLGRPTPPAMTPAVTLLPSRSSHLCRHGRPSPRPPTALAPAGVPPAANA